MQRSLPYVLPQFGMTTSQGITQKVFGDVGYGRTWRTGGPRFSINATFLRYVHAYFLADCLPFCRYLLPASSHAIVPPLCMDIVGSHLQQPRRNSSELAVISHGVAELSIQ